jgi:DNA-binding PadR family transcriptional regulator
MVAAAMAGVAGDEDDRGVGREDLNRYQKEHGRGGEVILHGFAGGNLKATTTGGESLFRDQARTRVPGSTGLRAIRKFSFAYIVHQCIVNLVKINKELNAASAASIVLGILQKGESYGYAIVQQVRELSDGEVEWTDGMLYPILHRMESEGWVSARWGESETGRKRKYYRLEPAALPVIQNERKQWETVHLILNRLWTTQPA